MDEQIMNELVGLDTDNLQVDQSFWEDMKKERDAANKELDSHNDTDPDIMSLTISLD